MGQKSLLDYLPKEYECKYCNRKFATEKGLKIHCAKAHFFYHDENVEMVEVDSNHVQLNVKMRKNPLPNPFENHRKCTGRFMPLPPTGLSDGRRPLRQRSPEIRYAKDLAKGLHIPPSRNEERRKTIIRPLTRKSYSPTTLLTWSIMTFLAYSATSIPLS